MGKKVSNKTLLPQIIIYFHEGGEKRTFNDSENILYFNTIAASNILGPETKEKYKHSSIGSHLPFQIILKEILQFYSTL